MIAYIDTPAIEACFMLLKELPTKKALEHYTKGIIL